VPERAAGSGGPDRGRLDAAVRDNYTTNANLTSRRALGRYAVAPPVPQTQLLDLFDWPDDATVLDVGCGDGLFTSVAAERTPRGCVAGLDFSLGMLEALGDRSRSVQRVQGDANVLPVRDASVDVVLATWMLYHVDKPRALPEYKRVLRPGGRLLATTNEAKLLPTLDAMLHETAEEVLSRRVPQWLGTLDFSLENGRDWLAPHFGTVERIVNATPFEVPVAEPFITYIDSLRGPATARLGDDFDFDEFLTRVRAKLEARLTDGPIRYTRRIAFFVAYD
jgi:SAM-dependent methyltransferase